MKRALVTGASGQDGTYLVAALVDAGYDVIAARHRIAAPVAAFATRRAPRAVELDIADPAALVAIVRDTQPDFIFNLAALSSGQGMFEDPIHIGEVNGLAVAHLLEAIRRHCPKARLCQASSSEIFGLPDESPQSEMSAVRPRSPYGAAKAYADHMVQIYRRRFGVFACSAILFNHESPLRRPEFVTRKITRAAAAIRLGFAHETALGDLDARRDWGFAGDYMRAMLLMAQKAEPSDYVLATGETHSVRELCAVAFGHVGLDYRDYVRSDPAAVRPPEAMQLVGNAARAHSELPWAPRMTFIELVHLMVDADLAALSHADTS